MHVYHLADFLRIACSIFNKYHPTIIRGNIQIAQLMLQRFEKSRVENEEASIENEARVENERLATRRGRWTTLLHQHAKLFPRLI